MLYRLYTLDMPVPAIVDAFRQRHGRHPSVALCHPQALSKVQMVLPFARIRRPNEPIPQPGHLYLAAE